MQIEWGPGWLGRSIAPDLVVGTGLVDFVRWTSELPLSSRSQPRCSRFCLLPHHNSLDGRSGGLIIGRRYIGGIQSDA